MRDWQVSFLILAVDLRLDPHRLLKRVFMIYDDEEAVFLAYLLISSLILRNVLACAQALLSLFLFFVLRSFFSLHFPLLLVE